MFPIRRIFYIAVASTVSLFFVGCAGVAPNYAPSIDNVEALKKPDIGVINVGKFIVAPDMPGGVSLSMRASKMTSPVGANYGDYLAAALRQELELAKVYDAKSDAEISGELLRNNIDAGGVSKNEGQIDARFQVRRGGQLRFDKVKQTALQWEGSFAAAVAIPLAANNYTVMVQKLISELLADPEFIQAVRK